jgi:O-antigen ligase
MKIIEEDNFIKLLMQKKESWLVFLFAALYFLFPTVLPLSNVALLLIVVMGLFGFKNGNYGSIFKNTPVLWVFSALYAVVLVGSLYTSSSSDWILLHIEKYAKFVYAIVLVLILTGRHKLQRVAFNSFIAAMLFILLSTWLNVWFLLPWSVTQDIGWGKSHHVFGDYITQNVMMAFFTIIATQKFFYSEINSRKLFWGCTAVLAIISILHLSQGRTGLVLLSVGLLSYAFSATRGKALVGSLLATILALGFVFGSSSLLQDRFNLALVEAQRHDIDNMSSIGHRLYNYKITPSLIAEKPFFGHGTGAYHTEICRFVDDANSCQFFQWHPHNQFLFFGADHGFVGIFLYAILILILYRTALKSTNTDAKKLLFSITSILLVDSFFNSPLFSSRESQFFIYMLALLVSMSQRADVVHLGSK